MKIRIFTLSLFISLLSLPLLYSQESLKNILVKIDTSLYTPEKNSILTGPESKIALEYSRPDEVCEVSFSTPVISPEPEIILLPSGDYSVIDSLTEISAGSYRFKVKFTDLTGSAFLAFRIRLIFTPDSSEIREIRLFPFTTTHVYLYTSADELFIGEEKIFELSCDNAANIKPIPSWQTSNGIDYRVSSGPGQLLLHVIPKALGSRTVSIQLETFKPFPDPTGKMSYRLPAIEQNFTVRQSRLRFVNSDKKDITLDDKGKLEGVEIQLDNTAGLDMQKTYRIENREEPGGALIAEIFTKNPLTNNRTLCLLRVYNYHRESEGYLYIKDGDDPRFITNFSITPKTEIQRVSVLHEGQDWSTNLAVSPGETVDIKIEGISLNKGRFRFEDTEDLSPDSTLRNDNLVMLKIRIPLGVSKRTLGLFNFGIPTGTSLSVKEFQEPRDFDYITINYGAGDKTLTGVKSFLMSAKTIGDVVIDFDRNLIDSPEKMYGKQYLKITVKITGKNGELVEMTDIDNIVIVPGDRSPRASYYDKKDETSTAISLNKYLRVKTYDLQEWAKIDLSIENQKDKYTSRPFRKDLEIYYQKNYKFDIDVSFPTGLLINTFDKSASGSQYQNFGGISMSMMAQFSFYDQERPGKYKPYKIGAGFLALNAFNLSADSDVSRDMGIVIIGSLYPTRKDSKLTFPLHVGGGYKLNEGKWFVLIGPGISVRL
jgi:hypothetical protein